jgi:hypothetical protein
MESASTCLDRLDIKLDRLDRQDLDNGLDSASTELRQLDSSTARGFLLCQICLLAEELVTMKGGWAGAKVASASEEPGDARRTPVTPPYSRSRASSACSHEWWPGAVQG